MREREGGGGEGEVEDDEDEKTKNKKEMHSPNGPALLAGLVEVELAALKLVEGDLLLHDAGHVELLPPPEALGDHGGGCLRVPFPGPHEPQDQLVRVITAHGVPEDVELL